MDTVKNTLCTSEILSDLPTVKSELLQEIKDFIERRSRSGGGRTYPATYLVNRLLTNFKITEGTSIIK